MKKKTPLAVLAGALLLAGCSVTTALYEMAKGAVKAGIWTVATTYKATAGTTKAIYRIGEFTYEVVKAPLEWALTRDIETIDGLPPREAIAWTGSKIPPIP
jgi:rare lipoprotein A